MKTNMESTMCDTRSVNDSKTAHHMFESTLQSKPFVNKSALVKNNMRLIKMMNSDLELRNHESVETMNKE